MSQSALDKLRQMLDDEGVFDENGWREFLRFKLEVSLSTVKSEAGLENPGAAALVWAQRKGRLEELLTELEKARPQRSDLLECIEELRKTLNRPTADDKQVGGESFWFRHRRTLMAAGIVLLLGMLALLMVLIWPGQTVEMHVQLLFHDKPIHEKAIVSVLAPNLQFDTTDSSATLTLPQSLVGSEIELIAETDTKRTWEPKTIKVIEGSTVSLRLVRRKNCTIHVQHSGNAGFVREGIKVTLYEKVPDSKPLEYATDPTGDVYFEAKLHSQWQLALQADKFYLTPIFDVKLPDYIYQVDLAQSDRFETVTSTDVAKVVQDLQHASSVIQLSATELRKLVRGSTPVANEALKEHVLYWKPSADRVLKRSGYIASFNDRLRIPNWVAYRLHGEPDTNLKRPLKFVPDPDLDEKATVSSGEYLGSGYDRGSLAAFSDMRYKSAKAVQEAFYMSVVCPQTKELNRGVWMKIEEFTRRFAGAGVYVIAGPVVIPSAANQPIPDKINVPTIAKGRVAVPAFFFRILAREEAGQLHVLSFLVPNVVNPEPADIRGYLTSVEEIERRTGLTFFNALPKGLSATALKSRWPTELWPTP